MSRQTRTDRKRCGQTGRLTEKQGNRTKQQSETDILTERQMDKNAGRATNCKISREAPSHTSPPLSLPSPPQMPLTV